MTAGGLGVLLLGISALGCQVGGGPVGSGLAAPPRLGFENVADAMQPSCGTLDCHGQQDRNLRLVGARGLRLAPTAVPGEGQTDAAEYEADYWSIVALEPETLAAVVADKGRRPERLILIRKARGSTRHKGGQLMQPGDDLDQCLVEWLKGNIAQDACANASRLSAPQ
jgi:hypothetical protein